MGAAAPPCPGGARALEGTTVPKGHLVPLGLLCLCHYLCKSPCLSPAWQPPLDGWWGDGRHQHGQPCQETLLRAGEGTHCSPTAAQRQAHSPTPMAISTWCWDPLSRVFWATEAAMVPAGHPARCAGWALRWDVGTLRSPPSPTPSVGSMGETLPGVRIDPGCQVGTSTLASQPAPPSRTHPSASSSGPSPSTSRVLVT